MGKLKLFLSLTWKISKKYYILLGIDSIISGIIVFVNAYLLAAFVEDLVAHATLKLLLKEIVWITIGHLFFYIISNIIKSRISLENIYVNDKIGQMMSEKVMSMSFSCLENSKYLDLKEKARYVIEIQNAASILIEKMSELIRNIVIILELLVFFSVLSVKLVISIIALNCLIGIIYILFKIYEKKFWNNVSSINRKFSYYLNLCFDEVLQKDIRLYNLADMLTSKVRSENEKILNLQKDFHGKRGIYNGVIFILSNVESIIIYTFIIMRTITKDITNKLSYSQFTFYISTAVNLASAFRNTILAIVSISSAWGYLNPFVEFMSLKNNEEQFGKRILEKKIKSIEFEKVSFSYPSTNEKILDNLSFSIKESEKISIVGLNGAGKSTIVKLICRLYRPTDGIIKINGYDIWEYDKNSYDRCVTAVFQDYKIFAASILENITCLENGNVNKAMECLTQLSLKDVIDKYDKGIQTELNKAYEDEGIDMSGGEKQKLAIARALYKGGEIFILDEPTSFLDPKAEAEIFDKFQLMTENKITIYISHRMASSTLCDKIIVINQGKINAIGSHEELVKNKKGLYYRLFYAQANNYKL